MDFPGQFLDHYGESSCEPLIPNKIGFLGLLVPVPGVFERVYLRIGFGAGLVLEKHAVIAIRVTPIQIH